MILSSLLHNTPDRGIWVLAILSGFLLALTFPQYNLESLAWIGLFPLFFALRGTTPLTAFWLGGVTGLVFYLLTLRWITHTMIVYGNLPFFVSVLLLLLLVSYMSFYLACFASLFRWCTLCLPHWNLLVAPALWITLEWLRGHVFTGFPWATLGYSQFLTLPVIQIADITGVYGISFLIVYVNIALFELWKAIWEKPKEAIPLGGLLCGLLLLPAGVLGYGWWHMHRSGTITPAEEPALRVALLQGNIVQDHKWDPAYREEIFQIYADMTRRVAQQKTSVDLIVWPEAATPFSFLQDPVYTERLLSLVKEEKRFLLFGSPTIHQHPQHPQKSQWFNSAFLVSPAAETLAQYNKIHLVPFGEYVPLRYLLFFVTQMVEGGEFVPGKEFTVMQIPAGRFSTVICYEIIFPNLVRRFVNNGAQFLVNLTNDAWFGKSAAPYQHRAMVTLRAVENRIPIIRAANTGISAIIDPRGVIQQETEIFIRTALEGTIAPKGDALTFYTRYGDLFAYTTMIFTGIFFLRIYGCWRALPAEAQCVKRIHS